MGKLKFLMAAAIFLCVLQGGSNVQEKEYVYYVAVQKETDICNPHFKQVSAACPLTKQPHSRYCSFSVGVKAPTEINQSLPTFYKVGKVHRIDK